MFNAFPEPCSPSGRSTNVKRALAAAVLSSNILPVKGTSHRLFNPTPSVAELTRGYFLLPLRGLASCNDLRELNGLNPRVGLLRFRSPGLPESATQQAPEARQTVAPGEPERTRG